MSRPSRLHLSTHLSPYLSPDAERCDIVLSSIRYKTRNEPELPELIIIISSIMLGNYELQIDVRIARLLRLDGLVSVSVSRVILFTFVPFVASSHLPTLIRNLPSHPTLLVLLRPHHASRFHHNSTSIPPAHRHRIASDTIRYNTSYRFSQASSSACNALRCTASWARIILGCESRVRGSAWSVFVCFGLGGAERMFGRGRRVRGVVVGVGSYFRMMRWRLRSRSRLRLRLSLRLIWSSFVGFVGDTGRA